MFSIFLNSSSDATYGGHDPHPQQQLPFSSTFLHHQEDAHQIQDQLLQFYQLQPPIISDYGDQQTLIHRPAPAVKKDRHSKIRTAQGLRDRRVRLSIGTARRFFDLQDMLGFDQPSKTLDWLLGNSTNAIHELAAAGNNNVNSSTNSSSSHSTTSASSLRSSSSSNCIAAEDIGPKTTNKKSGNELNALAARTKARARARERTLEKLTSSRLVNWSQLVKVNEDDGCSCPDLSFASNLNMPTSDCNNLSNEEVSVVDSRHNTPSTTIPTPIIRHQQNLVIAREGESYLNNLDYYFPNLPSSWDMHNW